GAQPVRQAMGVDQRLRRYDGRARRHPRLNRTAIDHDGAHQRFGEVVRGMSLKEWQSMSLSSPTSLRPIALERAALSGGFLGAVQDRIISETLPAITRNLHEVGAF